MMTGSAENVVALAQFVVHLIIDFRRVRSGHADQFILRLPPVLFRELVRIAFVDHRNLARPFLDHFRRGDPEAISVEIDLSVR